MVLSRGRVKLSKPLHRDLGAYALAAGAAGVSALALSAPADAQIVYTPAHELIGSNGSISIDLNHDGIADLTIREVPCSSATSRLNANSLQVLPAQTGGGVRMGGYTLFAAALSGGAKIGQLDPFVPGSAVMANWTNSGGYYFGSWVSAKGMYLGIRFAIDGETHYGWARLSATYSPRRKDIVALLTGYAYETEPNGGIRAGDKGQGGSAAQPTTPLTRPAETDPQKLTLGALALGKSKCGVTAASDK
jgi:hypothetical protein